MPQTELEIVRRIEKLSSGTRRPWVRLGIGDDTAILRPLGPGQEILLTTDQVIEKTHFIRRTHPERALGHKTLARGLSDIAAMGGVPKGFLLSLSLPGWARGRWLGGFFTGLLGLSQKSKTPWVGGDVARSQHFAASVTVVGAVPTGKALKRSGARPGELLCVSGRLGGSTLGFQRLRSRLSGSAASRDRAIRQHLYPEPRLSLGRFLRGLGATAAMDLSDGLVMDLSRLIKASGVGAVIEASEVPLFPGCSLTQALHGGEEYELLFTLPPDSRVPRSFEKVPLRVIGRIRSGAAIDLHTPSGFERLRPQGFQHFPKR